MNLRRYRQNSAIRDLFATVELSETSLIQPYFIYEDLKVAEEMPSIFGQKKHTLESVKKEIELGRKNGIHNILLFFIPKNKCTDDFDFDFEASVISDIKKTFKSDITIFTDMCLCSQTESGHCGILGDDGKIDNAVSVEVLAEKSLIHAQAGSDVISPSDMMDDRISAIRKKLDQNGFDHTMIMSYSSPSNNIPYQGPTQQIISRHCQNLLMNYLQIASIQIILFQTLPNHLLQ